MKLRFRGVEELSHICITRCRIWTHVFLTSKWVLFSSHIVLQSETLDFPCSGVGSSGEGAGSLAGEGAPNPGYTQPSWPALWARQLGFGGLRFLSVCKCSSVLRFEAPACCSFPDLGHGSDDSWESLWAVWVQRGLLQIAVQITWKWRQTDSSSDPRPAYYQKSSVRKVEYWHQILQSHHLNKTFLLKDSFSKKAIFIFFSF